MAQTYENNTTVLSKVKVGDTVYYVKDAAARAILDTFGTAAIKPYTTTVNATSTSLPTAKAVYTAIQNAIGGLTGAMHYRGVKTATTEITDPASGDVIIVGTKEYVYDGSAWQELGDEGLYVTSTTYNALVESLGDLAYKSSASGTLTNFVTGITGASYTPEGTVTVTPTQTSTSMTSSGNFTPSGTVSLSLAANKTGSISSTGSYTPAGTVSTPTITVATNTANVYSITAVGTLPSCTLPTINTKPTASFVNATMDTTDTEMLVLTSGTAVTDVTLNAGSFSAGTLPTKGSATSVVTSIKSATSTKPTFTGTAGDVSVSGSIDPADLSATFTGTQGSVSVSGNYSKTTSASGTFSGTAATITPTLTKSNKTVSVS